MNEENYDCMCINFETFLDIGTYIINQFNEPRTIMNTVLQELLALHGPKKIKQSDSELFSVSSDEVDPNFKYYISEDEVFVDLE
jgi:hypothetical protein